MEAETTLVRTGANQEAQRDESGKELQKEGMTMRNAEADRKNSNLRDHDLTVNCEVEGRKAANKSREGRKGANSKEYD